MPAVIGMLNAITTRAAEYSGAKKDIILALLLVALGCILNVLFEIVVLMVRAIVKAIKRPRKDKAIK